MRVRFPDVKDRNLPFFWGAKDRNLPLFFFGKYKKINIIHTIYP